MIRTLAAVLATSTCIMALATPAAAQTREYNIPAGSLKSALDAYVRQSGGQVVYRADEMRSARSPGVRGQQSAEAALTALLAGSGFATRVDGNLVAIVKTSGNGPVGTEGIDDNTILVTGSRIRGAKSTSPVYSFETRKAREEGITDMTALAAAIPQNFTGGQNPGVGNGAESFGSANGDSSTALNLRGLGPGATLTLLNGHRLAYNQNNQAVDFSSIPFAAVERVEIMPDGASALYGSDAIGGVANIILKRDLRGIIASATVGAATEGGYVTQNYNMVGGTNWQGGGIVLTGNFDRNSAILARDRTFTASANGNLTLYPATKAYAFVGSGHQQIASDLAVSLDAVYSRRTASRRATPYTVAGPVEQGGALGSSASWNLSVAPTATLSLARWDVTLAGSYGQSRSTNTTQRYPSGFTRARFDNETSSIDLSAEGPVIALPGGDVRLAVGAGYRRDSLVSRLPGNVVSGNQDNLFGYGEINIPLFAPEQAIGGLHRLSLMAAVRYEDYPGLARLATPKLGLAWSPTPDADIKVSWGKSFKTPTLLQRFNPTGVLLYPGDLYGMRDAPAGQTILSVYGGRQDLEPERAESFAGGIVLHPRIVPELEISASYFQVGYRNRVVLPIRSLATVFTDSAFSQFVRLAPSASEIADTIALSASGLDDQTGTDLPFDPSTVYAILDERYQNVSRDNIHGLDVTARYRLALADGRSLALYANATYLKSRRILIAGQSALDLAGTIYNPPHVKVRGGVGWADADFSANAVVNHIGGVIDDRRDPDDAVAAMTTFDLSLKRRFAVGPQRIDLQASALNIFNAKPDIVKVSGISAPYDFTNYSAIGRYISLSITASF